MYLLDAIDAADGTTSVNIIYDERSNTFALVAEERQDPAIVAAAELETCRADLIRDMELNAMMAFGACQTVDDATACWAARTSTVSQSARLRIKELGGDVDEATARLNDYFLTHPKW